jgi:UDP-N-acetylglucosamine 3-dehydrogenase
VSELGAGIVGAGYMGRTHAEQYQQVPGVRVVAVYDQDQIAAERLAESCGAEAAGGLDELLAVKGLDVVSICTPDAKHREPAVAAAQAGKHILLEKPLATTMDDALAIMTAVEEARVVASIGFVCRFIDAYRSVHAALRSGRIGRLITIDASRLNTQSGAARVASRDDVLDFLAVHDIDMLRWVGGEIRSVFAMADQFVYSNREGRNDTAQLLFRFECGALGRLLVSWAMPDSAPYRARATLSVIGTEGLSSLDSFDDRVGLWTAEGSEFPLDWRVSAAFLEQTRAFVTAVREGTGAPVVLGNGLSALQVVLAAKRSLELDAEVAIDAYPTMR